jgi:hypothetical protein
MGMALEKPFAEYVAVEPMSVTGDAQKFQALFPYAVEGTNKVETRRYEWSYSGTQAAVDENAGVDGLALRRKRALELFQRSIEVELGEKGDRIYEVATQKLPIWGKKK